MIIPDVNLLVYAHVSTMPRHTEALAWWKALLGGDRPIGLAWATIVGFVRLTTSRRVFKVPLTTEQALGITDQWMAVPVVQIIECGSGHYAHFRRLIQPTAGGNVATDAHLAALAIEHSAELHSNDSDFARFSGLKWVNPLG